VRGSAVASITQVRLEEVISRSKNLRACSGRDRLASALNHFVCVPIVQFAEGGPQVGLSLDALTAVSCLCNVGSPSHSSSSHLFAHSARLSDVSQEQNSLLDEAIRVPGLALFAHMHPSAWRRRCTRCAGARRSRRRGACSCHSSSHGRLPYIAARAWSVTLPSPGSHASCRENELPRTKALVVGLYSAVTTAASLAV
jgi:hypothetical protein